MATKRKKRKPILKTRAKSSKKSNNGDDKPAVLVQVDTVPRMFYMISRANPKAEPARVYALIIGPQALKFHSPRRGYGHNFEHGILINKDKLYKTKEDVVRAMKMKPAWLLEYGKIERGYMTGKGHELAFVTMDGRHKWGEKIYRSEAAVTQAQLRELRRKVQSSKSSFRESERKLMSAESRLSILKRKASNQSK